MNFQQHITLIIRSIDSKDKIGALLFGSRNQLFSANCLIGSGLSFIGCIFNIINGYSYLSILFSGALSPILFILYIYSRLNKLQTLPIFIFFFTIIPCLTGLFLTNGGIDGPILQLYIITLFLICLVTKNRRTRRIIFVTYIFNIFLLYYVSLTPWGIEFINSYNPYLNSNEDYYTKRLEDHLATFIFVALSIYLIVISFNFVETYLLKTINKSKIYKEKLDETIIELEKVHFTALAKLMNPHCLSNWLNTLKCYIAKNDTESSFLFIDKFSSLMRKTLDNLDEREISIEREIEVVNLFVELEQMMYEGTKNAFSFIINIEDVEDTKDEYEIPTQILQPYVENSIEHGLFYKNDGEKKKIELTIKKENDNQLLFKIEDNGVGVRKTQEIQEKNKIFKKCKHYGTKITRDLIRLKSGDNPTVESIHDSVTKEVVGTKVSFKMPIIRRIGI